MQARDAREAHPLRAGDAEARDADPLVSRDLGRAAGEGALAPPQVEGGAVDADQAHRVAPPCKVAADGGRKIGGRGIGNPVVGHAREDLAATKGQHKVVWHRVIVVVVVLVGVRSDVLDHGSSPPDRWRRLSIFPCVMILRLQDTVADVRPTPHVLEKTWRTV